MHWQRVRSYNKNTFLLHRLARVRARSSCEPPAGPKNTGCSCSTTSSIRSVEVLSTLVGEQRKQRLWRPLGVLTHCSSRGLKSPAYLFQLQLKINSSLSAQYRRGEDSAARTCSLGEQVEVGTVAEDACCCWPSTSSRTHSPIPTRMTPLPPSHHSPDLTSPIQPSWQPGGQAGKTHPGWIWHHASGNGKSLLQVISLFTLPQKPESAPPDTFWALLPPAERKKLVLL